MIFRKAVPDDALDIAKVHVDSWRDAYKGLLPDDRLERLDYTRGAERFRESITQEAEMIYVTENDGGIVGFLALGPCRDPAINSITTGEIYALYLTPEYWRKGIGGMMSREAESLLASCGYSRVVLWVFKGNERACRFYEAMGFVADGTTKVLNVGAPLNSVRYEKIIAAMPNIALERERE